MGASTGPASGTDRHDPSSRTAAELLVANSQLTVRVFPDVVRSLRSRATRRRVDLVAHTGSTRDPVAQVPWVAEVPTTAPSRQGARPALKNSTSLWCGGAVGSLTWAFIFASPRAGGSIWLVDTVRAGRPETSRHRCSRSEGAEQQARLVPGPRWQASAAPWRAIPVRADRLGL